MLISIIFIITGLSLIAARYGQNQSLISPLATVAPVKEKTLESYSIENLKLKTFPPKKFYLAEKLKDETEYSSHLFILGEKESSVSGILNFPKSNNPSGTIVLLRGFIDRQIFQSGTGTKRIGERLAANGFITVAPDFLGYGKSSSPSAFPLEERFQTYTTILTLLNSLTNLYSVLNSEIPELNSQKALENIGIFGHSNGGHIALATLEISGKSYPTVLWAPVGKPFPFSVLAYTDEYDDKGKALRKLIADFEKDYQIENYSIDKYFDYINAPVQIHQGLSDQEVPYWWSEELVQILKSKNKDVSYFTYPGEDHNFNKGTWETLATRTLNFYIQKFNAKVL